MFPVQPSKTPKKYSVFLDIILGFNQYIGKHVLVRRRFAREQIILQDVQRRAALHRGILVEDEFDAVLRQIDPVLRRQVIGDHPHLAEQTGLLDRAAGAVLAVRRDVNDAQVRVFLKGAQGQLIGVVVPVKAVLQGQNLHIWCDFFHFLSKTGVAQAVAVVVRMGRKRQHLTALRQHGAHQTGRSLTAAPVVHTDEAQPAALGRVNLTLGIMGVFLFIGAFFGQKKEAASLMLKSNPLLKNYLSGVRRETYVLSPKTTLSRAVKLSGAEKELSYVVNVSGKDYFISEERLFSYLKTYSLSDTLEKVISSEQSARRF